MKWWLWVFLGPDTACFVMDPTRSGAVLARHAGIDQATGQLVEHPGAGEEKQGPRQLVISSDFYSVYTSAGRKACGLVNLYCWAHVRRYFVRAGDANPDQLSYWTAAWLERIKNLYTAHEQLSTAWAGGVAAELEHARTAWDEAWASSTPSAPSRWLRPGCRNRPRRPWPRWTGNGTGWSPTATTR